MPTTFDMLKSRRQEILALAREYGVTDVRIFGSVARGEDDEKSDVDFLIRMENNKSLFDMMEFQDNLQKLVGRKCDVISEGGLHWVIRDDVLSEARPV